MINRLYQLVHPKVIAISLEDLQIKRDEMVIRPLYMTICRADQRYYWGLRDAAVLEKKLPMALIHECCGVVDFDPTHTYSCGQYVVLIPNIPPSEYPNYIYENYAEGTQFRSSGKDGFLHEVMSLPPDRVLAVREISPSLASMTEFVSVAVHAVNRFILLSHDGRNTVGIWGDGSLAFTVAAVLKNKLPNVKVIIVGRHPEKLSLFSFADGTELSGSLPKGFKVDHAFDCTGSEGSVYAVDAIIQMIRPQGTIMLMGVCEKPIPMNTRRILEKGLTILGVSRSGRKEFAEALSIIADTKIQNYLQTIRLEASPVRCLADLQRVFAEDLDNPFKTTFLFDI